MPHPIITNRVLRRTVPTLIKLDDFTLDYQSRIAATGSSISKVALQAHDDFFKGCKSDGIWNLFYELGTFAMAGVCLPLPIGLILFIQSD